jgi:acyl transferase domain-containing protein
MSSGRGSVAIVGMAGRFPGAATLEEFWNNLRSGVESIEFFGEEDREPALVDAGPQDAQLIRAGGMLEGVELFDAELFGISRREAEIMDPQHRLFLECAWEAMDNAGYCGSRFGGAVGVFGGSGANTYLLNLLSRPDLLDGLDPRQLVLANDKDYLTTRISYRLGLTGPSVTVQTACSTSLVAVHLACQSLLNGECDLALAGGVSLRIPQRTGYRYTPEGIDSSDGHCRAFDAHATGTVPGSGAGVVVLRREADAAHSRDCIRALIRGSAVNNDGGRRAGFASPAVAGQAAVVSEAQAVAGLLPEHIGFIEAHGTGTPLGDPIEAAALGQVFRSESPGQYACAIGSVKTNIGHLDAASGVAGLIKTVLALEHGEIPPSLGFETPNPELSLQSTGLYVQTQLGNWPRRNGRRYAGVSSFGIGGTNAHVVLEEAPPPLAVHSKRIWHLLPVSARSSAALGKVCLRLADCLAGAAAPAVADVAFTLRNGRAELPHRRAITCKNADDAVAQLRALAGHPSEAVSACPMIFLFPGQGVQRFGMARALWLEEPTFRSEIEKCCEILQARCGIDVESVLLDGEEGEELRATELAQPALFAVEYALAQLWMSWGVHPAAVGGHSLGEFVAACVAGVFTLEEALWLVAERGRLLATIPGGRMLAVALAVSELKALLPESIDIAAINAPRLCVVAGSECSISELAAELREKGVAVSELRTSHAFHSRMMAPARPSLVRLAERIALQAPTIPCTSNVTGRFMTACDARDPAYWGRHLIDPVQFASCLGSLREVHNAVFLELGPGGSLSALVRRNLGPATKVIASLGHAERSALEVRKILGALGSLWENGASINWEQFAAEEQCRRVPLPTYPFERTRHWVDYRTPSVIERGRARSPTADGASPADALTTQPIGADLSETEMAVLGIWEDVLGPASRSIRDNFFDMHGDSLLATQIMSRIRSRFGCQLLIRDFFEDPTIASLSRLIDRAVSKTELSKLPPMVALPAGVPQVISYAQQRLWFVDRVQPGNPAYNIVLAIRSSGTLDVEVLSRSLSEVIRRHDVLRTFFSTVDGMPVPVIAPAELLELAVTDLTSSSEATRSELLRRLYRQESTAPFDLLTGPLYRIQLIKLCPTEHVLLITVHHVIFDVWSSAVFFGEVGELYRALVRGEKSPLPPLPFQYSDFAAWQRQLLESGNMKAAAEYWLTKLGGQLPRLLVPPDLPIPRKRGWTGAIETSRVDSDLSAQIRERAARQGATPFIVLLAAYCVLLHQRTRSVDLVLGTDIANRNCQEIEPMIGFFVNQLALRMDFGSNPDVRAMIDRVREVAFTAFTHQDYPFDRLVEALQPRRVSGEWPLFGVKFVMRNVRMPEVRIEGLDFEAMPVERYTTTFDFVLTAVEESDTFVLGLEYSTELYTSQTIRDVLEDYVAVLVLIARDDRLTLESMDAYLDRAANERAVARRAEADRKRAESLAAARRRPIPVGDAFQRRARQ